MKGGSKSLTGRWNRGEQSACSGQETNEIQESCLLCKGHDFRRTSQRPGADTENEKIILKQPKTHWE